MDKVLPFIAIGAVVALGIVLHTGRTPTPELQVVEELDLERYMGVWYEIASIPASFQRRCVSDTTATYTLRDDGSVEVANACRRTDGRILEARGRAWPGDAPAKLRVSFAVVFGIPLFTAPYWVIDLAPDYSYAVVGHPSREYGWVLAREPELPEEHLAAIFDRLAKQGYDPANFRRTEHTG
ncbi:MAG: lipocalin family protein [Candidatus Bipolaricaulota bacterium]